MVNLKKKTRPYCLWWRTDPTALLGNANGIIIPKTRKFGCVGKGDLTFIFFSKENT